MVEVTAGSFTAHQLTKLLLEIFAALTLALACVGIYSVIAFSRRTHPRNRSPHGPRSTRPSSAQHATSMSLTSTSR
jgi:hypothetical protein